MNSGAQLSTLDTCLWGAAGAAVWLVLVYALPACVRVAQGLAHIRVGRERAIGAFGVVFALLVFGAVAAFLVGAQNSKEALGYGLGWQGVFGEYARKGRPWLNRQPPHGPERTS